MSTSASTHDDDRIELWTMRGLIVAHKKAALLVAVLLVLLVGTLALVTFGGAAGPLTNATTCTEWGNSNQNRQTAYARMYLSEHGPVPKFGGTPAAVINAVNWGCGIAYGDDVADTATVIQAIQGTY